MLLRIDGIKNIHGRDIDLPGRLLVTGANGTGKSAILDSLSFALTGRVPRLGADPGALRQIMADGASVVLEGDGWSVGRRLRYTDRKARVETRGRGSGVTLSAAATETLIEDVLGGDGGSLLAFDFRTFLGSSAADRRRVLLDLLPAVDPKNDCRAIRAGALQRLSDDGLTAPDALLPLTASGSCDDDPDALLEAIHEATKAATRDAQAMRKAADAVVAIDPAIRELAQRLPEAEREHAHLLREQAAARHAAAGDAVSERSLLTEERDRLRRECAAALPDVGYLSTRATAARQDLAHHEAQRPRSPDAAVVREARRRVAEARDAFQAMATTAARVRREHAAMTVGTCPATGTPCPAPEHTGEAGARLASQHAVLAAGCDKLRDDFTAAQAALDGLEAQAATAMDRYTAWAARQSDLYDAVAGAQRSLDDARCYVADRDRSHARLHQIDARLEVLPTDAAPDPDHLAALEARLRSTAADMEAARQAQASMDLSARIDVDTSARTADAWRAAWAGAQDGHSTYIDGCIGAARDRFARNLRALGLEGGGFTADRRAVDLEIRTADGPRSLDALSDGQQALVAAALMDALPGRSRMPQDAPRRWLTLEAGEVSENSLAVLLRFLAGASFAQVVIATHLDVSGVDTSGWAVLDLGGR